MPANNRQMKPGAVLLLTDGQIWIFVRHGRRSPPLTIYVTQGGGPEREIPLGNLAEVMWSP